MRILRAAREATKDVIFDTKQEPFIRCELFDYGVFVRLRYFVTA